LTLLLLLFAVGSAQDLVNQGNSAMQSRKHQEAVLLYQKAMELRPDSAEAHFDLGDAFYRLGDYSRALDGFERAAVLRRKGRLAAMARYNAGHCMFQQALGLVYTDPQGALALLEHALGSFREAQRLDRSMHGDATHNAEVVQRWLQLVRQQVAQQHASGSAIGQPASTPGPAADAILGKDNGIRNAGGARVRPMTAGKDW
jgi:tetratricopeptide (TPR) repeat protein